MDALEIQVLEDEIRADIRTAIAAAGAARQRHGESDAAKESCAFQICRFYNIVEQLALRVAKAFENSIDDEKGWHTVLLRRLSIPITGVRPLLFDDDVIEPLQELRAFRHVFVHAYDLRIHPAKLALLLDCVTRVEKRLPGMADSFFEAVRSQ